LFPSNAYAEQLARNQSANSVARGQAAGLLVSLVPKTSGQKSQIPAPFLEILWDSFDLRIRHPGMEEWKIRRD
jgi:hypothetical protein